MAGRMYAGYELLGKIASGGMAEVYLARRFGGMGFERLVALKLLVPTFCDDDEYVAMFADEARLLARLTHHNIAQILDFGQGEGRYYLALEYVHGESLAALLTRSHERGEMLTPAAVAFIGGAVARALAYAHKATDHEGRPLEVLHRDVSPHNVLVGYAGSVKLIDFGVARATDRRAQKTKVGTIKGKISYMAPEQFGDAPLDQRADVFSLGVVLWEMAAGTRLFRHDSDAATMRHVVEGPIPRLREVAPATPPELEAVVMSALARNPAARPASALAVARRLDEVARRQLPFDEAALASRMNEAFAAERARKEELLKAALAPSLEDFLFAERPDLAKSYESLRSSPSPAQTKTRSARRPPLSVTRRASLVVSFAGLLGLSLLAAPSRDTFSAPAPAPAPAAAPAPVPAPVPVPAPAPAPAPAPVPAAAAVSAPAPARKPPRKPAEASDAGFLTLESAPWAYVSLDGRASGTTPVTKKKLRPGRHRIRLTAPDGRLRDFQMEIVAGQHARLRVNFSD